MAAAARLNRIALLSLLSVAAAASAGAQPTITASVSPSPSRLGWNNTVVLITYACTGAVSCPGAETAVTEGSRQLFRHTVADESSRTATVSTEINIDFAPATIALASPAHDSKVTAARVTLTAEISDALSGIAGATCNGEPALLQGSRVECVMPLRNGINDLVVQVTDHAGNSASSGVQVHRIGEPSHVTVVPSSLSLMVGQSHAPQVVDEYGQTLADVEWSILDRPVVSLDPDRRTFTAVAPGTTTLKATWKAIEAVINVRVLPGPTMPDWTTRWVIAPLPGYRHGTPLAEFIKPMAFGDDAPSLIAIEREIAGSRLMLRALDGSGPRQLWIEAPAISPRERIGEQHTGDDMGGGLLRVETTDGRSNSIVRVGRPIEGMPWRYTPPGRLGREFANYDGIVDVVETPPDGFPVLVGIDGVTGSARFRVPLPRSSHTALNVGCVAGANARRDRPASVGSSPTVLDGGTVNLALSTTDEVEDFLPCGTGVVRRQRTVQLLQVRDEVVTYKTIVQYPPSSGALPDVELGKVLPDGHGGQLVKWSTRNGSQPADHTVVRVTEDRLIEYRLPALGVMVLGENDLGVTTDGRTIVGFIVSTGKILWTHRAPTDGHFRILMAVAGGGLNVATERGIEHIDHEGRRRVIGRNSR